MKKILLALSMLMFISLSYADTLTTSYAYTNYDYAPPAAGTLFDDSSDGVSLMYSFTIDPVWAIDVSYKDLGIATRSFGPIQTKVDTQLLTVMANAHTHIATLSGMPLNLHGMIGVARANIEATVGPFAASDNDVGLAYGAGLRLWITGSDAINLTATKYDISFNNVGAFDLDPLVIELGYTRRF